MPSSLAIYNNNDQPRKAAAPDIGTAANGSFDRSTVFTDRQFQLLRRRAFCAANSSSVNTPLLRSSPSSRN